MSTNWKSQITKGDYRIQFETDDFDKYKSVEKVCTDMIDRQDRAASADELGRIRVLIDKARECYRAAKDSASDEYNKIEAEYLHGLLRGLLDAWYVLGGDKNV